jgi:molybdenum cofactor synthesis domain-containing protein
MQELDRMRPPQEAWEIIARHLRPLASEQVPVTEAGGRILAVDLRAPEDFPPFAASTMDGFAVSSDDTSPWREILGDQPAGKVLDVEVTDGYAVRIMTGAPLPPGADAVVPVEATELAEDHVVIHQEEVAPGENVRQIGSDLKKGDLVLPAGTQLGPAEIGLIASMGLTPVPVSRRPRVSVISTGDELVEPEQPVGPGQIRDSNRFSLKTALLEAGADVTWTGMAPDRREDLETLLNERTATDDIVITSGGVSMGELDLIKAILFDAPDVDVHFRRLYLKPGKPLNFATKGDTLIFGLPGNPVSSLVTFEVFIRRTLLTMAGATRTERPRLRVKLDREIEPGDRIEFVRGVVSQDASGDLIGRSTGMQRSSRLASFIGANALLVIAPRESTYLPGETVEAIMLGTPHS